MSLVLLLGAVSGKCPRDLGIAINTGDKEMYMNRVEFALSHRGWLGNPQHGLAETWADKATYPVIVFASTRKTEIGGVPVRPCCGGVDYSKDIASAQLMREHTWSRMVSYFPHDTRWFISTEDDAWWDLTGLCTLLESVEMEHGDGPIILGGGHFGKAIYGPYVVMNKAMLELFANETLLHACREAFLGHNVLQHQVYDGAPYNLDHFISYCAFFFFPRFQAVKHLIQLPAPVPPHKGPYARANVTQWPDFIHNAWNWRNSKRAEDLVASFENPEFQPIVVHHTTIDDMEFFEKRARDLYARGRVNRTACCDDFPRKRLVRSCCPGGKG